MLATVARARSSHTKDLRRHRGRCQRKDRVSHRLRLRQIADAAVFRRSRYQAEHNSTAIGKALAPAANRATLGNYPVLGRAAAAAMPNATLVEFPALGHAPQIQEPDSVHKALLDWMLADSSAKIDGVKP
jgi:pimeloyl-ACP methyl ester carboxylesterase